MADPPNRWTSIIQIEVNSQTGKRVEVERLLLKGIGGYVWRDRMYIGESGSGTSWHPEAAAS